MSKPLLICTTPVRNEAWILHAFLKATSFWADYIIIADQDSTDGSREIALSYPKVILVENSISEMHQAQTRKKLFNEIKKIKGEKIVLALDADEFLSGNFMRTEGWRKILDSKPGDVFLFRRKELFPSKDKFCFSVWMYFGCYFSDSIFEGVFLDNYIHECRLPYPNKPGNIFNVEDISFIHIGWTNAQRQKNKDKFYQVITRKNEPNINSTRLFRQYNRSRPSKEIINFSPSDFSLYSRKGLNIMNETNFNDIGNHYILEIKKYFKEKGVNFFSALDIWDKPFLQINNIKDPRSFWIKLFHQYLRSTKRFTGSIFIRIIDKILHKMKI